MNFLRWTSYCEHILSPPKKKQEGEKVGKDPTQTKLDEQSHLKQTVGTQLQQLLDR